MTIFRLRNKSLEMKLFFLFSLIFSTITHSTEVDNFTDRYIPLEDSTSKLNLLTNKLLKKALQLSNREDGSCNSAILYKNINEEIGGFLWAKLENLIEESNDFKKRKIPREKSIYNKLSFIQFFPHFLVKMGSTINLSGHLVGVDKIGHLVGMGYEYFKISDLEKKGMKKALEYGESYEDGFFGIATTGIYSYADLSANYKGLFFWRKILGTISPYIKCDAGKWNLSVQVNWDDYIDSSLDEAINCNRYRDEDFEAILLENIMKLELKYIDSKNYKCSIKPRECNKLRKELPKYSDRIINPEC